jgi:hypothetical protein
MQKREQNRFNMFKNVIGLLEQETTYRETNSVLNQSFNNFKAEVAEIENLDQEFQKKKASAIEEKNKLEDNLIENLDMYLAALKIHADLNSDLELTKLTNQYTKTDIANMRELDLLASASNIISAVNQRAEELANYGLTTEIITQINQDFESFKAIIDNSELNDSDRKTVRSKLSEKFDSANDILANKLDLLMKIVKVNNADLFNRYESARVIFDR